MTASRDPDRMIHHFLLEGGEELHDQVYDAVRADIEHKRQRVFIGPWRLPTMNKIVPIGLGAAAVLGVLVVGTQLVGGSAPGGVGAPPTVEPTPSPAPVTPAPTADTAPSPAAWSGVPEGPFLISSTDDPVQTTVNVSTPGWFTLSDFDALSKDDDSLDPPQTVGALLLAWAWPAGTGFHVYGDPCRWTTTIPETPATTPDEIAAAFGGASGD